MKKSQIGSFPPEQVAAIGRAVGKFMREQRLKSEDIRRESGFNASRFGRCVVMYDAPLFCSSLHKSVHFL